MQGSDQPRASVPKLLSGLCFCFHPEIVSRCPAAVAVAVYDPHHLGKAAGIRSLTIQLIGFLVMQYLLCKTSYWIWMPLFVSLRKELEFEVHIVLAHILIPLSGAEAEVFEEPVAVRPEIFLYVTYVRRHEPCPWAPISTSVLASACNIS